MFECGKLEYITANYFAKKNCLGKGVMKEEVIILDSSYSIDKDDCNFIAFMASNSTRETLTQPLRPKGLSK